ncbi:MAG: hypothetical protein COY81_00315 [Candidatus Pacebacteria bacterium CG_4_10_14_0_8_um_filter_43_12]|nr:MAG: hypothetical protein COY81_00315 [Candidatus Pacebacteria bacterium CG_4_10_14_0_8_um_filter_43_12]
MSKSDSTTSIILKKSLTVSFFIALSAPLGYVMRLIYSRTLSVELFGLFYALIGFIDLWVPFQDWGTGFSVSYYAPKLQRSKNYQTIWLMFVYSLSLRLVASTTLALIIIWNSNWLANHYFKVAYAENLLYIFSLYLLVSGIAVAFKQLFIGLQKESYYASAEPLRLFLIVTGSCAAIFLNKEGIITYSLILAAVSGLIALYYWFLLYKFNHHFFLPIIWKAMILRKLATFSWSISFSTIIYLFTNQIGLVLLTFFHTVSDVGTYNIILAVISLPTMFLSPLQSIFFPMVSEFMSEDKVKVRHLVENLLRILPFITLYFNFFIFLFPQFTIGALFSNQWLSSATLPLMIIAVGYIFSILASYLTKITDGMGLVKERVRLLILIAITNLGVGAFLIYYYGIIGLVVTNSLIYLMTSALLGSLIYSRIKFNIPVRLYLKYALFLGVIYLIKVAFQISPNSWYLYLSAGAIYTVLTTIFAYTQNIVEKNTLLIVMNSLKANVINLKFRRQTAS